MEHLYGNVLSEGWWQLQRPQIKPSRISTALVIHNYCGVSNVIFTTLAMGHHTIYSYTIYSYICM